MTRGDDALPSHAPITETTWLAVFDGGRAAVFANEGFADAPNLRFVFGAQSDGAPTRARGTDKPGRYPTPAGGRAAVDNIDRHKAAELRFVDDLAKTLDKAAAEKRFERLVVIAPAKLIARFRTHATVAAARVVAELAGDFVHAPIEKIEQAFRKATARRS
jgi:protein required for attachment to host cells